MRSIAISCDSVADFLAARCRNSRRTERYFPICVHIVEVKDGALLDTDLLIRSAVFAVNHYYSHGYSRDLDRQGTPNIDTLMFTPYLRIGPMHLTIVVGARQLLSTLGLLFFGGLKTVADILMHFLEHSRMKRAADSG
ncbi:MAG: DUF6498-containing protein [Gammaproteobacteria bacterium]|nr:DUF6498-containing protein [Gammaproteobacteria bacterium]